MQDPFGLSTFAADQPLRTTQALVDGLYCTVRIARALVDAEREIDLEGLDRQVGLVCARALDLPPEQGRSLRPELIALCAEVDALRTSLQRPRAAEDG